MLAIVAFPLWNLRRPPNKPDRNKSRNVPLVTGGAGLLK
jgi:hypothetical protein